MGPLHTYSADLVWTGAGATGTASYTAYSRNHEVRLAGKPVLLGSSDASFRGDPTRHNPEELLVAALAQCHMLWFLHLAATAGVVVIGYSDQATGTMRVEAAGHGQFTQVVLRPHVTLTRRAVDLAASGLHDGDGESHSDRDGATVPGEPGGELAAVLADLHERAHEHCFISRSVNFPVRVAPAEPTLVAHPAGLPTQGRTPPRGTGT